jgi:Na+/proline symporter
MSTSDKTIGLKMTENEKYIIERESEKHKNLLRRYYYLCDITLEISARLAKYTTFLSVISTFLTIILFITLEKYIFFVGTANGYCSILMFLLSISANLINFFIYDVCITQKILSISLSLKEKQYSHVWLRILSALPLIFFLIGLTFLSLFFVSIFNLRLQI